VMAFSFLYDVFRKSIEVEDVVKRAVVFTGCCLGRASLLYMSSFITNEVNL